MKNLVIGGGLDILHQGHRDFLKKAINTAMMTYFDITKVIFYLKSDEYIAKSKGEHRPYFSYLWRLQDVYSYLMTLVPNLDITIFPYESTQDVVNALQHNDIVVIRDSNTSFEGITQPLIKLPEIGGYHSSDFLKSLKLVQRWSDCQLINVGAVLVRQGKIIALASNDMDKGECVKCPKRQEFLDSGAKHPYDVTYANKCIAKHAEDLVLMHSQPGDDILITHSPCSNCAKLIIDKQIRRVVYLEEYLSTKGLDVLKQSHVAVRRAGL